MLFKLNMRGHDRLFIPETDKKSESDVVFVRDFVVPYLSDIFYSLASIEGLGYMKEEAIKIYL